MNSMKPELDSHTRDQANDLHRSKQTGQNIRVPMRNQLLVCINIFIERDRCEMAIKLIRG
jgi:hypothetical protein